MSVVIHPTILELEVLEDRCAPTAVHAGPTPSVSKGHPTGSNPYGITSPLVTTSAAQTAIQANHPAGSPVSLPGKTGPSLPGISPLGAGAGPLNNSIPNGATVQSSSAGLSSLSPFLPTYYLSYTQVGPFYTGSGSPGIAPNASTAASLDQPQADGSSLADASAPPAAETSIIPEAEWLAALLPALAG